MLCNLGLQAWSVFPGQCDKVDDAWVFNWVKKSRDYKYVWGKSS